jgi:hypothetical protein
MKKFLITEEEKSNILGMHYDAMGKTLVNEAATAYDPWLDFGGAGKGLKFKSQADWDKFIGIINVSFTAADGPAFPNIMKKNNSGVYELKVYEGGSGYQTAEATIEVMGLSLFYIASANGFRSLNSFANPENVYTYYTKVYQFLSRMVQPSSGIATPTGLADAIKNNTSQVFSAVKKDWANIVTLKLAPIYKARVDSYAVAPAQK